MSDLQTHFVRLRRENPSVSASVLIVWARDAVKVDAVAAEIEWHYTTAYDYPQSSNLLDIGEMNGLSIRIYRDDEPYDWGDIEPSESERDDLEVIGVGVRIDGDEYDLDNIWSVGYLDHDGHKQAIETAIWYGFIDYARMEIAERARLAGYVETAR